MYEGFQMKVYMTNWKELYKSFTKFSYGDWGITMGELPTSVSELEKKIKFYADRILHINGEPQPIGKWYPSEEEPMSPFQKKMLPHIKTNARKAEMMIEEKAIIQAINKFWMNDSIPFLEEDEEGVVTDNHLFDIQTGVIHSR